MPHRSAFEAPNPLREGLRIKQSPEPCVMVIFGATGDLTHRKLLPALYNLALEHPLPTGFSVVGFARRPYTDEEFRQQALESIKDELFSSILSQVPRSALPAAFAGTCRLFG